MTTVVPLSDESWWWPETNNNNYTGLQNYDVFQWLYKRMKLKANNLNYSNSKNESKTGKKFGPKRKLNTRNDLFLTLVRLRLGLTELDLVFRF